VKSQSILNSISPAGIDFLKDAFAPPDFPSPQSRGVPDAFAGKSLIKDHYFSGTITTGTAVQDTIILVKPTPGEALSFTNTWPAGNPAPPLPSIFIPYEFNDSNATFPNDLESVNLVKYRYLSLCVEVIPLAAPLSTSGAIAITKAVLAYDETVGLMTGGNAITTLFNKAPYVQPTLAGAYSVAIHQDPDWAFKPVYFAWSQRNPIGSELLGSAETSSGLPGNWSINYTPGVGVPSFTGIGDHESIFIRLTGCPAATVFSVRVWAAVEYIPNEAGMLIEYAHQSPVEDKLALRAYELMADNIPIAVPHAQNASFWKTLLGIFSGGLSLLGNIPGPWGLAAKAGSIFSGTLGSLIPD